ncbi:MAG: hypothetical protein QNJ97_04755 [Myxococcota bacterium]|nr:hypothetical protein [Myxococcota bacterium]
MFNNIRTTIKSSFYNKWNSVLTIICICLTGYVVKIWFIGNSDGRRMIDELTRPGALLGRAKPPASELEAHYNDRSGSLPVAPDFDADPGEICGNGKRYYWTSKPPKKPIPPGWKAPPLPGTDPGYKGPDPTQPFKESPYAMPSSKAVLARPPIRDRQDPTLVTEVKKALARAAGKIGYLGTAESLARLGKLGHHLIVLDPAMFAVDDDEKVAQQLLSRGLDVVLVDRTIPRVSPWVEEKMSSVALRLRDAVSLAWFHPVVLGSGTAMFRLAPPFEIPLHVKRLVTSRVRTLLTGDRPVEFVFNPPLGAIGDDAFRVIVSLRWRAESGLKGRKLVKRMAHGPTLRAAIDSAVRRIKSDWSNIRKSITNNRTISVAYVPSDLREAVSKMEIEIDVLYDFCQLTDRSPHNLLWYVELGLEGLSLRGNGVFHYLEPNYAVHMESKSEIRFLEKMLMKSQLKQFLRNPKKKKNKKRGKVLHEAAWVNDDTYQFGRFRTVNWIERPGGGDIVELYRGVPLKTIWDVNRASLLRSLELGAEWLMSNQTDDGQYAYKYFPVNKPGKRWMAGGNIVRHALNPYTLLMVNKIKQDPKYVESAQKGITFTLKFLRQKGNRCCICHRDPPARYYNAKLNAVAVTILSILKLGEVADISEYKNILSCLAEEMLYMQDPNGHFWQYDVPLDHPYYGAESTIHAGEFIFVLARLHSYYKEERFKIACDKAIDFYMKQWRHALGERTKEGIYDEEHRVNLIGIVPWLVTAMQDLYKNTGDKKYADLGLEAQDWIDNEFFWWPHRAQYPDYVGASFKVLRELPAVNSCQYAEGAAAAYDIAKRTGRNVEMRRQVVVHSMRYCLQLQFDDYGSTFFLPVPDEAMGGYRYTLGHLWLRSDNSYHVMAAIAQAVEYLEPDDYPAKRPLRIPPVLRELLGGLPNTPHANRHETRQPLGRFRKH